MRRVLHLVAMILGITPTAAFAQSAPTTMFGPVTLSNVASDPYGAPARLSGFVLSAPLRLALQASIPSLAGSFPNCASREEPAGNAVGGIPVRNYTELYLTPRLVLSGFSQLGCPIDAGIGTALTYAVPLQQSLWLVFGAGIYAAPGQIPLYGGLQTSVARGLRGNDSAVNMGAHTSVVWKTTGGRAYSVGVGTIGHGRQGLTFGGGF